MGDPVRVMLEHGKKKRVVACAFDWPGWDRVIESDGKTENAQRVIALDPFTLAALRVLVDQLDTERAEFGQDYWDHGQLFCWEDGRPPHPDTITRRFKRLAERAGLALIDLHDVRHSYATAGRDARSTGWR